MKKESLLKKSGLFCIAFVMCCFALACNPFNGSHSCKATEFSVVRKYGNAIRISKWTFMAIDEDGYVHIVETKNQFNPDISKDTLTKIKVQNGI